MSFREISCPPSIDVVGPVVDAEAVAAALDAEGILAVARQQAEQILEDARQRGEQAIQEAQERFFSEHEAALQQALQDWRSHLDAQHQAVSATATKVVEAALKTLGLSQTDPQRLGACISQLAEELSPSIPMRLHVARGMEAEARLVLEQLLAEQRIRFIEQLQVVEDGGVQPGDAALVTPTGARIQVKYEQMLERLLAQIAGKTT